MPFPTEITGRRGNNKVVAEVPQKDNQGQSEEEYEAIPPVCFLLFWGDDSIITPGDRHPIAG